MAAPEREQILSMLELARWAPSGDNTQPWRFELLPDGRVRIHGHDTVAHCLYDYQGWPSRLAHGALIETLSIAASCFGFSLHDETVSDSGPGGTAIYEISFSPSSHPPSVLADSIPRRSVNRRALTTQPLTEAQRTELARQAAPYTLHWIAESPEQRRLFAWLLYASAKIRLIMPEAFEVHRSVIEWNAQYSQDRMPDQSVGLDPLATSLMRWSMKDWRRIRFLNRWLGGTLLPRIQLDYLPGIYCAGHFALCANQSVIQGHDWIEAGRALQRVWLSATNMGLQMQPEMTPLLFSWYAEQGKPFSVEPKAWPLARDVQRRLSHMMGPDHYSRAVFIARLGHGKPAQARSLRKPLHELLIEA